MIFPQNVHKRAVDSKKLLVQDKTAIMLQLVLILNVICFFLFRFIFIKFLGLNTGWALIAQLVLFIFIFIFIFRIAIFKEDEKMQELKDRNSDSFARYMFIRDNAMQEIIQSENKSVIFEYTNGCVMTTFRFKFGSNDDSKAFSTRKVLDAIYGVIGSYNFIYRLDVLSENFAESTEYQRHLKQINSVNSKVLSYLLRTISKIAIDSARTRSNSDVIYLTLRSKIPGDVSTLENLIQEILKIIKENTTSFRDIKLLNIDDLLEFYREYYNIKAIDLAMMKAIDLSSELENDYSNILSLYSLKAVEGKNYTIADNIKDRLQGKEQEI